MREITHISILGCGWLGTSLAKAWLKKGAIVNGSVRDEAVFPSLAAQGIRPFRVNVEENGIFSNAEAFWNCDVLVVSIPPARNERVTEVYPRLAEQVVAEVKRRSIPRVVFISSTSVYPETGGEVNEETSGRPEKPSGIALWQAEQLFLQEESFRTLVVKPGGLIGPGRLPGNFIRKAHPSRPGNVPVNLVHSDDVVEAILHLTEVEKDSAVYNIVSPEHPLRSELYSRAAELQGIGLPDFPVGENVKFKTVSSQKLIDTGFRFTYRNPLAALEDLYEQKEND
ncbi:MULTISPECIES: SDR family oxidoreductase [Prolixibacter]|uniref:Epimerase n=1 Tax=Prolixibacter denitrificans TaxID=1541063 RepID=A0A2P8C7J5_9BACT|nr:MULTISPECIES: SDR family oxidoreductase [Prolixibacter]PSK80938.1 nucleoside-diphosphate-sugar epimerase [Prolixibacter denitrificans]GET22340.1 epimerase [Prolixibacter denitrificans]GET25024.1 epimerase [Prolixibacter sp. NT017]